MYPGDNSVNFEPQQEQQQQQSSSQVNNRFTEPKLSNGQLKLPQTDKDDLSCGSKSEGEIESEEDDELDSTVTSTSDPTLVPEPSTPPDSPVLPSPCTEATTMSSLPGIRKDTQHVMVNRLLCIYFLYTSVILYRVSLHSLKLVIWILNYLKMYLNLIAIC